MKDTRDFYVHGQRIIRGPERQKKYFSDEDLLEIFRRAKAHVELHQGLIGG